MNIKDRPYIQKLATHLKIKDLSLLDAIVGPNELKELLAHLDMSDYLGDNSWVNLHTHSNASDGQLSPEKWLENAKKWQENHHLPCYVIALTDHDTVDGLIPVLKKIVQDPDAYKNLKVVLGCELSSSFMDETTRRPVDFELLHYGINPYDKEYVELLKNQSLRRIQKVPLLFKKLKEKFPDLKGTVRDFQQSSFFGVNFKKGLGCNWLYQLYGYFKEKNPYINKDELFDYLMQQGVEEKLWRPVSEIIKTAHKDGSGFLSIAHPYRIQLKQKISDDFKWFHPKDTANDFIGNMFSKLSLEGISGAELFYGNLNSDMQMAFDRLSQGKVPMTETEGWVNIIQAQAKKHFSVLTGGNDTHTSFLGTAYSLQAQQKWDKLIECWRSVGPLVKKGYRILGKEVTMGIPGPCMPPISSDQDIGIGSPYGMGAERIWNFFGPIVDKILLGPSGRTSKDSKHSPYVSGLRPNPFFIPLEDLEKKKLISKNSLQKYYAVTKNPEKIDFALVEEAFDKILREAYQNVHPKEDFDTFVDNLVTHYMDKNTHPYIADLQVQIPYEIVQKNPDVFLKGFTLGSPPEIFSPVARNWGFPVFDPGKLWTKDGNLAKGGKLWQDVIRHTIKGAKGGLRIDHFIGFVNPYVISTDPNIPNGRLYSSYDHPILKKYAWKSPKDFGKIVQDIVLPVMKECHLTLKDLYPEDIGKRPEQMDDVMKRFGLGRLLVAEFKEPNNPNHIYQLMKADGNDVAVLDTHDTPSIQMYFDSLNDEERYAYAQNLASSLRFNYNDSLKSTEQLTRMQWGELMTSPAERVQGFFTSWTGQVGRYNQPGNPNKWMLRCVPDFEKLYFKNLNKGRAYNPLDAVALAIYARGDTFYTKNKGLVDQLRQKEDELKTCIREWLPYENVSGSYKSVVRQGIQAHRNSGR